MIGSPLGSSKIVDCMVGEEYNISSLEAKSTILKQRTEPPACLVGQGWCSEW